MKKKAPNKNIKFSHAAHLIRQGTLAGLMLFSPGNGKASNSGKDKVADKVEMVAKKRTEKQAQKPEITLSTPIKIDSQKDIETLFDYALATFFAEIMLEEVPMPHAYDDHGKYKGSLNTICTGSTTAPANIADYNKKDVTWFSIYRNPNTFWYRSYSYEEMLQLDIGWTKYRNKTQNPSTGRTHTTETILARMFDQLKGLSITPNEFSAILCAVYNNESNITQLLPKIKADFNDKIACANHLRTWWQCTAHNPGHKTRCMFEALVFLNRDNFCGSMMTMQAKAYQTKTGQWAGASCINAEKVENEYCSKKITTENATDISNACKNIYHKQLYNNGAVSPEKAMKNLQKYFIKGTVPVVAGNDAQLMTDYMNAIALYNQRKYKQALEAFLDIQKRGGEGADLLNDIALTHYKLEEYSKCITICQKILKTPQYDEYAKACYNAGRAYEAQENYTKAEQNYEKALEYYNKYGIADADDNVDYKGIYKQAIKRVADAQKTTQDAKKQDKATKNVKGAPAKKTGAKGKKASLLWVGAATVGVAMAKKRRDRLDSRTRIAKRTRAK